jgi:hypothetical protein
MTSLAINATVTDATGATATETATAQATETTISPPGTVITPTPSGQMLTDANLHSWTFGAATTADGTAIFRDGLHYAFGFAVMMQMSDTGVTWVKNAAGQWYSDNGNGYTAQSGPPDEQPPVTEPPPEGPPPDIETILDAPFGSDWTIVNGAASRSNPNTDGTTVGWLAWGYATLQRYVEFPASGEYSFSVPAFADGIASPPTPPQSGLLLVIDGVPVATVGRAAGYEWANCVDNLKPPKTYTWQGSFLQGTHSVVIAMNAVSMPGGMPAGYLQQIERMVIASTGKGYPTEPAGNRDPALQPFSSLHWMNRAINDGATWSQPTDSDQQMLASMDVVPINSEWWTNGTWTGLASDPVWQWRAYGSDCHCVGDNAKAYPVHAPQNMVPSPGDNGLFITDATNKRYQYCGFSFVVNANAHTATSNGPGANNAYGIVIDSYNATEHAYHQQIGASGGMIRQWELDGGEIKHKLIFGMAGNMMTKPASNWTGFGWPACESDYNAPFGQYSGGIRYGDLLGIPKDVPMPTTLRPGGKVLWKQLQTYGGTIGVQAGAPNKEICIYAEKGAHGSALDDMGHDWPIIATQYLRICRNNSRDTPGGPGNPLAPLLPGVMPGLPAKVI